jgi:hypothetical protein
LKNEKKHKSEKAFPDMGKQPDTIQDHKLGKPDDELIIIGLKPNRNLIIDNNPLQFKNK